MKSVRLFPFEVADGPTNMAADEVMLEAAVAGLASFRCYSWSAPTLSLGYFQPSAVRFIDPRLANLPWVRRASGGAALVHHHELTYALALPAGFAWQPKGKSWICRMHGIIANRLAQFGVDTRSVLCGEETKLGEVLCFEQQTAGDLTVQDNKIVGSAQRKQRGAMLQHGAILLARSEHTPTLPGIQELTGKTITNDRLRDAIEQAIQSETGWEFRKEACSTSDLGRIRELVEQKYGSLSWNEKR